MVDAVLVDRKVEAGRRYIDALVKRGLALVAAFWVLREDVGSWRLYLVVDMAGCEGPVDAYHLIESTERQIDERGLRGAFGLGLSDVTAVGVGNPLAKAVMARLEASPHQGDIELPATPIGRDDVLGAYLYRLNKAA